jgi:hypothetical protein
MKLILAATLALIFNTAQAAHWVYFDKSVDGSVSYYYDSASIVRTGDKVKMVTLWNYEVADPEFPQVASSTWLTEHNCTNHKSKTITATAYLWPMADGVVFDTITSDRNPWVKMIKGTIGEAEQSIACEPAMLRILNERSHH